MAATPFNVSSFKSKLSGGGARPALFKITWSDDKSLMYNAMSSSSSLLVKAGSLPASNIAPLVQNYAGRAYKLQGFRTFDPWTVTIINDEDFAIRTAIKQWMEAISGKMDGTRATVTVAGAAPGQDDVKITVDPYTDGTATVTQLNQSGENTKSYQFHYMWPTELAPIPLDWSSDMVEEYSVTFAYDYWTSGTAAAGVVKTSNDIGNAAPSGTGVPTSAG